MWTPLYDHSTSYAQVTAGIREPVRYKGMLHTSLGPASHRRRSTPLPHSGDGLLLKFFSILMESDLQERLIEVR